MKPNTLVVYRGPSQIDKQPILMLASGFARNSQNAKTGAMLQTYIIREDLNPLTAKLQGQSKSVCGGCPLIKAACYVNVAQAPLAVWSAWQRGSVPEVAPADLAERFRNRAVRAGSYGDPAAVPLEIWDVVLGVARMHTGYTHQWRAKRFAGLRRWCMASCDTEKDFTDAVALGWATYRVRRKGMPLLPGETQCPASSEAGHLTDCRNCGRCGGLEASGRFNALQLVSIEAHGKFAHLVHRNKELV